MHTKGPLHIDGTGSCGFQIRDERNRWIGTANNDHGLPECFASNEEARPNALLWAAASELLEQLECAVLWLDNAPGTLFDTAAMHRAIAKAEGREADA